MQQKYRSISGQALSQNEPYSIAVFSILADVVEVMIGCGSTAHWPMHFIRLNGWLRHSFALLITS